MKGKFMNRKPLPSNVRFEILLRSFVEKELRYDVPLHLLKRMSLDELHAALSENLVEEQKAGAYKYVIVPIGPAKILSLAYGNAVRDVRPDMTPRGFQGAISRSTAIRFVGAGAAALSPDDLETVINKKHGPGLYVLPDDVMARITALLNRMLDGLSHGRSPLVDSL